jgi:hypothetical protein
MLWLTDAVLAANCDRPLTSSTSARLVPNVSHLVVAGGVNGVFDLWAGCERSPFHVRRAREMLGDSGGDRPTSRLQP